MGKSLCSNIVILGFEFWLTSFLGYFSSLGLSLNSSVYFIGISWGLKEYICAKHTKQSLEPKSSTHISYYYYCVIWSVYGITDLYEWFPSTHGSQILTGGPEPGLLHRFTSGHWKSSSPEVQVQWVHSHTVMDAFLVLGWEHRGENDYQEVVP